MHDIRNRLLCIEDQLLSALANGSFDDFERSRSGLSDDIEHAIQAGRASTSVLELAQNVFGRAQQVACQFFLLQKKYEALTESFTKEVEDVPGNDHYEPTAESAALPPYIAPAHRWLLENLHCPYPTAAMKKSFAEQSGSSRRTIDAWFIDVRKRIGWSSLRRSRYSGKKENIVRAATAFYLENKVDDAALSFARIQEVAKDLYSEKLQHSALASQFDTIYLDRRNHSTPQIASAFTSNHETAAYPSPTSRSPSPRSRIAPSCVSTFRRKLPKRKRSCEREDTEDTTASSSRSPKRQRIQTASTPRFGLPSPASSSDTLDPSELPTCDRTVPLSVSACSANVSGGMSPVNGQVTISTQTSTLPTEDATDLGDRPDNKGQTNLSQAAHTAHSHCPKTSGNTGEVALHQERTLPAGQSVNRRRCVSELGLQFPSVFQHRIPKVQAVSDPIVTVGQLPVWSFDPSLPQLETSFDVLGDLTACDVEAFDFSAHTANPLLDVPNPAINSTDPFPVSDMITPPLTDILPDFSPVEMFGGPQTCNSLQSSMNELLVLLNFPSNEPFLSDGSSLSALPFSTVPSEAPQSVPHLGASSPINMCLDVNQSSRWDAGDIERLLSSLAQQPVSQGLESFSNGVICQDERARKLKQLAEMKEAQQRLEAEIAAMPQGTSS